MKEAKERQCSQCEMVGHTKRTCVKRMDDDYSGLQWGLNTRYNEVFNDVASEIGWESSNTIDFIEREFIPIGSRDDIANDLMPLETFQQPNIDNSTKEDSWGR